MNDLSSILQRRDIELTLTNEQGEFAYLGSATTVTAFRDRSKLKFLTAGRVESARINNSFTTAVLHSGRDIFRSLPISPIRLDQEESIEIEV